jgi:hypothetical protein
MIETVCKWVFISTFLDKHSKYLGLVTGNPVPGLFMCANAQNTLK